MIKFLILSLVFVSSAAQAGVPTVIWCSRDNADGSRMLYDFEVLNQQLSTGEDVKVAVHVIRLLPRAADTPPDTLDVRKHEDVWVWGKTDSQDKRLIHLQPSGFLRFDETEDPTRFVVTYKTPFGRSYEPPYGYDEIANVAPNCVVPEPKAGIGN